MSRLQRSGSMGRLLGRCPRLLHCAHLVLKTPARYIAESKYVIALTLGGNLPFGNKPQMQRSQH